MQNTRTKTRIKIDVAQAKGFVGLLTLLLVLSIRYCYLFSPVAIDVTTHRTEYTGEKQDFFQLFQARLGQPYSPKGSPLVKAIPKENTCRFVFNRKFIDTLYFPRKIRLDPTIYPGTITFKEITIF